MVVMSLSLSLVCVLLLRCHLLVVFPSSDETSALVGNDEVQEICPSADAIAATDVSVVWHVPDDGDATVIFERGDVMRTVVEEHVSLHLVLLVDGEEVLEVEVRKVVT